ncbi:MAG: hypothetical protein VX899_14140 [Myxococcota bacterium]|nr:hypothetical protein [Myxococcota bacterium]
MSETKGFDPLASLFDGPDLGEFTDPGKPSKKAGAEHTDPLISVRADAPLDMLKGEGADREAIEVPEPGIKPSPPDDNEAAEAERTLHKEALAKALAKAAVEKAKAQAAAAEKAAQAAAVEAARKAALEKAQAQAADLEAARERARAKAAPPTPEPAPAPVKERAKGSRLDGLAQRSRRPTSALEAARAAAAAEEQAKLDRAREAAEAAEAALPEQVAEILRRNLKGVDRLRVGKALRLEDRQVLKALWKAHRARFAQQGAIAEVVSTSQVIRALDKVAAGQLVAATVRTESSDYLVFIDLAGQATLAAFPDARAWYANQR